MQRVPFVVDETPYVFWDWNLQDKNLEFLRGIDGEYFRYIAESNANHLDDAEKQHFAALNLRIAYSHGLETLFALLGALVQAPHCPMGWVLSYRNHELHSFVRKITAQANVKTMLVSTPVTWHSLALVANQHASSGETARRLAKGFGDAWSRFANDFVRDEISSEYNSIKHGLRVRLGGFGIHAGIEKTPGVQANPEDMHCIGQSVFGSTFYSKERIGGAGINWRPRHHARNWSPGNMYSAVALLGISVQHVANRLRIQMGEDPGSCKYFLLPDDAFGHPWMERVHVTDASFDVPLSEEDVDMADKQTVLEHYRRTKSP